MSPTVIKASGYLVSCVSVVCLGAVAWSSAAEKPLMLCLLIAGMATSITGMAMRYLSHLSEKAQKASASKAPARPERPPGKARGPRPLSTKEPRSWL